MSGFNVFNTETPVPATPKTGNIFRSRSFLPDWSPSKLFKQRSSHSTPVQRMASFDDSSILAYPSTAPRTASLLDHDSDSISTDESCPFDFDLENNSSLPPIVDAVSDAVSSAYQRAKLLLGRSCDSPSIEEARLALNDIGVVLNPPRKKGPGYIDPKLDPFTQRRIKGIETILSLYTSPDSELYGRWGASSKHAAISMCRGRYCARVLRRMARQYIADRSVLPENPFGKWNSSLLMNEDLCQELGLFLRELGKDITALKVQVYLHDPNVMIKHGITKKVSLRTAQQYLHAMGFQWTSAPKGQYVDGHERGDVVHEREKVYVPRLDNERPFMTIYDNAGNEVACGEEPGGVSSEQEKRTVLWYHDESIFYAHDRRRNTWYHKDAPAKPYKKGEGHSLMVADFISAEYGWLRGPKTQRSARCIIRPGKNRDGYFTNDEMIAQVGPIQLSGCIVKHILILFFC